MTEELRMVTGGVQLPPQGVLVFNGIGAVEASGAVDGAPRHEAVTNVCPMGYTSLPHLCLRHRRQAGETSRSRASQNSGDLDAGGLLDNRSLSQVHMAGTLQPVAAEWEHLVCTRQHQLHKQQQQILGCQPPRRP